MAATGPSYFVAVIKVADRDAVNLKDRITGRGAIGTTDGASGRYLGRKAATAVANVLEALAGGNMTGNLWLTAIDDAGTKSAATIACTRANASTDTVTFTYGGKAITLTEGTDFSRGADDTACAANLATAINAHPVLKNIMTAAGDAGDCDLTAKFPTALIQDLAISTNDATAFGLTQFASATEGAAQFFLQHFALGKDA